eukprot:CAMPEP_0183708932 /NCGR_PEP_ID=MMETSP0737-20130205/5088_1 /TAXON_ID=385413 /ORGANISM="Thalassiosira miniscula, Strain CCMP1093" /LENGTH=256 /DNA_ID=CAMNT_0025936895 /DNA_START=213 /DNA_END=984 /DNA_ORIENTATION=-
MTDAGMFDYLCILDFEATCNDTKPAPKPQEIIEFPTLLLNVRTGVIEREFHYYIKPDVHPTLTEFCTELTGITQDTVNGGISLREALDLHQRWIDDNIANRDNLNAEGDETKETTTTTAHRPTFTYITCGDWDLKTCLPNQLAYHNEPTPSIFRRWLNIKREYQNFYETKKPKGMVGMLRGLNMELEGDTIRGLMIVGILAGYVNECYGMDGFPGGEKDRVKEIRRLEATKPCILISGAENPTVGTMRTQEPPFCI